MECPNCGVHIGRFELNQNCKNCGVNLFYCQQEKLLSEDAKRCELEFASFRILTAKLKAAFIGGPLQIARMALTVICVGVLFIPFATVGVSLPLFSHSISFGGYGLYKSVSDGSLPALFNFADINVSADIAKRSLLLTAVMLVILLAGLAVLAIEFLSFINIRKSAFALCVLSAVGAVISIISVLCAYFLAGASLPSGILTASVGPGGFAALAAFCAMLFVNIFIIKNKIAPKIREVDLLRVETRKKVKSGELSLDDLPLPVFETDEEREKRLSGRAPVDGGGLDE